MNSDSGDWEVMFFAIQAVGADREGQEFGRSLSGMMKPQQSLHKRS